MPVFNVTFKSSKGAPRSVSVSVGIARTADALNKLKEGPWLNAIWTRTGMRQSDCSS